jgi:hypothetical protein
MIARAGLATGVSDFLWACVLSVLIYGSTFGKLWQGVASVPFGASALDGGAPFVLIGILLHFTVAFAWSAVLVAYGVPAVRRSLERRSGAVVVALIFGPLIWVVMSRVVIPLFTHQARPIQMRWWVQFAGHFLFVGLPMTMAIHSVMRRQPGAERVA